MSINNASKFVARLYERDSEALALLPKGVDLQSVGSVEIEAIAKAAKMAGWDFTADELQEAYLDSLALDEGELSAVAGGITVEMEHPADGPGGCTSNYYAEPCGATWEYHSLCSCTDYKADTHYTKV